MLRWEFLSELGCTLVCISKNIIVQYRSRIWGIWLCTDGRIGNSGKGAPQNNNSIGTYIEIQEQNHWNKQIWGGGVASKISLNSDCCLPAIDCSRSKGKTEIANQSLNRTLSYWLALFIGQCESFQQKLCLYLRGNSLNFKETIYQKPLNLKNKKFLDQ